MKRHFLKLSAAALLTFAAACGGQETAPEGTAAPSADRIFTNGRIYTADSDRNFVEAFAVNGDEILAAGSPEDLEAFASPDTQTIDLGGRLVLPGLHDAHIHPISAMPVPVCTLENAPLTLAEIADYAAECTAQPDMAEDDWLVVMAWNFAAGNQPGERFQTMREALDYVSAEKPVILRGSDGHHYAVNSIALARAQNADGDVVGFSKETLETDFTELAPYIGVDETGEPNGRLTESYALGAIGAGSLLEAGMEKRRASPELLMEVTLPRGITAFMDAAADPDSLDIYDALLDKGEFHARARLSLYFDPSAYADENGDVDYETLLGKAKAIRAKYEDNPLIEADFLKLFADGVLEGDPLSDPPMAPNAALSRDYLQPIYEWDEQAQWVKVTGYVDTDSDLCAETRAKIADGEIPDVAAFKAEHGFHPLQCVTSNGVLQHPEDMIMDYVREGDAAGFTWHIHAIGDRAIKTALDALEAATAANGTHHRHIITHLQLVRPEDQARFAKDDIYASFTFAWASSDKQYDTTVIPFIDRADGPNGVYDPDGYYYQNAYPAKAIQDAGGTIIAGSDAPVDTIDPRPFVNIEGAVNRAIFGPPPLNLDEAISIYDAVDAYTINAAQAMHQADVAGSLEPGKKADFVIIDQDIFALAENGEADRISETKVLETWFGGEKVYSFEE
ncbi:amidohydrolase [Hyphococcus luteus]|uniref:Amidohydrolase n=1 Tax=Hyphococcus luteus TaxID=2058213 RepID=A0A2S7K4V3_9PROT|nr:amidohydrolase family protein [Marinicaulis flavus]PQA87468.1 amidohydrolase [Marinicaulis flavus]